MPNKKAKIEDFFCLILRFEMKPPLHIAIVEKNTYGVGGFSKILRDFQSAVVHGICLSLLTIWVGEVKKSL